MISVMPPCVAPIAPLALLSDDVDGANGNRRRGYCSDERGRISVVWNMGAWNIGNLFFLSFYLGPNFVALGNDTCC